MSSPETFGPICRLCAFPVVERDGLWQCRSCSWSGPRPREASTPAWLRRAARQMSALLAEELGEAVIAWPDPQREDRPPKVRVQWRGRVAARSAMPGDRTADTAAELAAVLRHLDRARSAGGHAVDGRRLDGPD